MEIIAATNRLLENKLLCEIKENIKGIQLLNGGSHLGSKYEVTQKLIDYIEQYQNIIK
jgi:hypothetical protein